MEDIFVYDADTYQKKRDLNVVRTYIDNASLYLSKMKDIPYDKAKNFIIDGIKNKTINYKDPVVRLLYRDDNGDKHKTSMKMSQYLKDIVKNRYIMAPTFTCYYHPKQKVSEYSLFTSENISERNKKKKLQFLHESNGNMVEAKIAKNGQTGAKLNNNSMSGAFVSQFNPAYNRSAHSSLTSVCRTCASFANINNERFLMGWRHFFSPNVVIENIISVLNTIDIDFCKKVIKKYNLHVVTRKEFRDAIEYSTNQYFRGEKAWKELDSFFEKLSTLEMTIYLYTGDFYHLRKFNDSLVRGIYTELINIPEGKVNNPEDILKSVDEDMAMLAGIILSDKLNYKPLKHKDNTSGELFPELMFGVHHIQKSIVKWSDLIQCFWINDCLPHDTADMPDMVRNCVLGGDTDSTLFTVNQWCQWYMGKLDDSSTSLSVAQLTIYFTSMMVRHYLAYISAIIGIPKKKLFVMAMKNEYMFPIFMTTRRTKNYIATICAQEGNLYQKHKLEVKGVSLKNSKAPVFIQEEAEKFMKDISNLSWTKGTFSLKSLLDRIANIEYRIYESICKGEVTFLSKVQIQPKENYNKPMASNYASHDLWINVFSDKYGLPPEPPYEGVRVNLDLPTKASFKEYVSQIKDEAIRSKYLDWLSETGKSTMTSQILPLIAIEQGGVPIEVQSAINFRKIIYSLTEVFYVLLEGLGFYMMNKNNTRLCLDMYPELFASDDNYWSYMSNGYFESDSEDG